MEAKKYEEEKAPKVEESRPSNEQRIIEIPVEKPKLVEAPPKVDQVETFQDAAATTKFFE